MKKVLFFCQDGVGGAERMTVLIGKSLDTRIYDVCFCLVGISSNSSIVDFIPNGIHIIRIPNMNRFYLVWKMVSSILKEKPFAVFSSVINISNKILPFRWMFPKVKVIIRCDNYLYTYSDKQQKMIAKLYPMADCIIAQTQEMKDELVIQLGINETKVVALNNPIDKQTIDKKVASAISPYQSNKIKHFVAIGRFNRQKGFDLLIDAFIEVCKTRRDVDLYIVGDKTLGGGLIFESLEQKAIESGIADLVHCVGYKDNPYVYLKYADCFVLSSRWEGLPNVLLESLYLGTPVAAFKCIPIIERIVDDGVNGFLAEKENVSSLAIAMLDSLHLGRVISSYKSASVNDFIDLF